jgi:hypothetical protein
MWLARDKEGELMLFINKPYRITEVVYDGKVNSWWDTDKSNDRGYEIYSDTYPELTFENSPVEVELKLKL